MTILNLISDRASVIPLVSADTKVSSPAPNSSVTRSLINELVRNISSPPVKQIVGVVFDDLLRLLECLDLIEVHLRKIESAEQTFALFQLIHDEASALVAFIHAECLKKELVSEELFDTFDGIAFAVRHDLERVFETNSSSAVSQNKSHAIVGRLYRAHDVLTNCLQQSTITLAMVFDPTLEGSRLFNNSDMRFRQSLQLCDGLAELLHSVEATEQSPVNESFAVLCEGIQKFRNESMELLMYTDWPQFEGFCERFDTTDNTELKDALHQFRCYLETLLGQVRMRAVLANVFPLGFGDERFSQSISSSSTVADTEWNLLAVAI